MSTRSRAARRRSWRALLDCIRAALHRAHRAWRGVPVEALVTDRARRRSLVRSVRAALAQLVRALATPLPDGLAVVVQQAIHAESPVLGCHHVGQRTGGAPFALVRLALQVDGRKVDTDELLAALADQVVALTVGTVGPSALVPLAPRSPAAPSTGSTDPLLPPPNGHSPHGDPLAA